MRKDIKINVDTQTDGISLSSRRLGISSENLQGKIIFTPKPFIDGKCRMYIEGHGSIEMKKEEGCYTLDILSSLLIAPSIDVCFKITEPEQENGVPIYATKILRFEVLDTIESNEPIPEQYPSWKDVLDDYVEEKKTELDTYTTDKKTELDTHKTDLETEMSTTKDTLVKDITNTTTESINEFNTNAETKTNAFNDNATEKTNEFNNNVESKTTDFNNNAETKLNEYNSNSTAKLEEYNTNATNKVAEFNNNVDSIENELTELASQMPWNTTEIQDSIHVEDSAKYSRNKLGLFGNLEQKKRNGYNIVDFANPTIVREKTSYTFKDDVLTIEQTYASYQGIVYDILEIIKRNSGKTLYFKCSEVDFANASKPTIQIRYVNNGVQTYKSLFNETLVASEYTIPGDVSGMTEFEIQILVNNTATAGVHSMTISKPMLTFNSDVEYEPYGVMPSIEYPSMPVVATGVQKISKLGKNFLNIPDVELEASNGVAVKVENNKIILNGTATSNRAVIMSSVLGIVLDGTYTFSQKVVSGSASGGAYRIYLKEDSSVDLLQSPLTFTSTTTYATNTIDTVLNQLGMYINKGNTFDNYTIQLQVEKGDIVTSYEEPIEKEVIELDLGATELRKIVNKNGVVVAQDRAVYREVDGIYKWQWEKQVSKYIINENTTVYYGYLNENYYVGQARTTPALLKNSMLVSSYLPYIKDNYNQGKESVGIGGSSYTSIQIRILASRLTETTTNGLKEYLTNNPLVVYGVLNTFSYEDCTAEQSEVLDRLHRLTLQEGTNNIYVESENGVTTELQLTYMQDLMSQINELKQAVVALGGNE